MIRCSSVRLKEVSEVTSAKRIYASDYVESGVPFYRSKEIIEKHHKREISTELFISEQKYREIEDKFGVPVTGDLLITAVGTLGVPYVITNDDRFYFKDGNLIWFRNLRNVDSNYLYYWMLSGSGKGALGQTTIGVAQPAYTIASLKEVELLLPTLLTQRKIAAVLTAYDDLIEVNKRRIAVLEQMAEELYREWFVRMRFPGHESTAFVKGVPEGWEVKPISSFCDEVRAGVKKKDLADDEPYVGLEHIPRKSIALKEWATAESVDSDKLRFNERDILFSKIRPYLHKVVLAHFSGACSSDTIILRPRERVYEGFLLFTVFSDTFIELATIASKGTKMPRADWAFLEKLELKIPPAQLLKTYQARFEEIFSLITNLLLVNRHATETRDLLLPRLISGKLSVEDLDIQFPPSMVEQTDAETAPTAA